MEKVAIPTYFIQKGVSMGLDFRELGLVMEMAAFADDKDFSFNDYVEFACNNQYADEDDRLSSFQVRQIVEKMEKEKFIRVIKFKDNFKVEWLPKSFGE